MNDWIITDLFTGEERKLPKRESGEPTKEWVEGWNACMEGKDGTTNPYEIFTLEHHDWEDGYESAEED